MVHVEVDPARCQGHGLCHLSAPGIFSLRDEDGSAYTELDEFPDELEAQARLGEVSCPERAIRVR
jgi:ferredoxin